MLGGFHSPIAWNPRPQIKKKLKSLFHVAIDYFESLFAFSSTPQREVVLYSHNSLQEKGIFHAVVRFQPTLLEKYGLLSLNALQSRAGKSFQGV